jgi:hypothetical protein
MLTLWMCRMSYREGIRMPFRQVVLSRPSIPSPAQQSRHQHTAPTMRYPTRKSVPTSPCPSNARHRSKNNAQMQQMFMREHTLPE